MYMTRLPFTRLYTLIFSDWESHIRVCLLAYLVAWFASLSSSVIYHCHENVPHIYMHTYVHRYSLHSGIWNSRQLAGVSIQEALIQWYRNRTLAMNFRDDCSGPQCNSQCPEEFLLGELDSNSWSAKAKVIISSLVLGITVLCVFLKIVLYIWQKWLQKKQDRYRKGLHYNRVEGTKKVSALIN